MLNRLILFLSTFNLISIVIISISSEMSVISEIIYGELYLVLCIVLSIISEIAIFCHFTLGRSITLDFIQAIVSLLNFILTAVVYINFYFSYYKIKSPVTGIKKNGLITPIFFLLSIIIIVRTIYIGLVIIPIMLWIAMLIIGLILKYFGY